MWTSKKILRMRLLNNIHIWSSKTYSIGHPKSRVNPRTLPIILGLAPLFFMWQHVFVNCVAWANLTKSVVAKECSWGTFWQITLLLESNISKSIIAKECSWGVFYQRVLLGAFYQRALLSKSNITHNVIPKSVIVECALVEHFTKKGFWERFIKECYYSRATLPRTIFSKSTIT